MNVTIEKFFNPDWIGVLFAGLALLVSIASNMQSSKANSTSNEANRLSEEANKISKEVNDKAEESNKIAKAALETANKELEMSIRERMSSFKVKLISIDFSNDGYACKDMKEALSVGAANCEFEIENTSDKYATSVTFEKFDGKLDGDGLDIGPHEKGKLNYIIRLYNVNFDKPEIKLRERNMYSLDKKMYWSNGTFNFSCLVTFTFYIGQVNSSPMYNWSLYQGDEGVCKTSVYSLEIFE